MAGDLFSLRLCRAFSELIRRLNHDSKTLRVTPAMAAGVTDRLWEIGDVAKMLEDWEASQKAAA